MEEQYRYTSSQLIAIEVTTKIATTLSMSGSFYIIWKVIGNSSRRRDKLGRTYHRILLYISLSDVVGSFGIFLGSLPAPAENLNETIFDVDLLGNMGNTATCDLQGFMVSFGATATNCYTAMLTVYFLLFVKYSWTEHSLRKVEPLFHFYSTVIPFSCSLAFLVMGWFNTAIPVCFIVTYPWGCFLEDSEHDCLRQPTTIGASRVNYGTLILMLFAIANVTVIMLSLVSTMFYVRKIEKTAEEYSARNGRNTISNNRQKTRLKKSKMVLKIACWYIVSYFMFLVSFVVLAATDASAWDYTEAVCSFFVSSQGMVNAIVYSNFEAVNAVTNMWSSIRSSFRNSRGSFSGIGRRLSFEIKQFHFDPENIEITPSNQAEIDHDEKRDVMETSSHSRNETEMKTDLEENIINPRSMFDVDFDELTELSRITNPMCGSRSLR